MFAPQAISVGELPVFVNVKIGRVPLISNIYFRSFFKYFFALGLI